MSFFHTDSVHGNCEGWKWRMEFCVLTAIITIGDIRNSIPKEDEAKMMKNTTGGERTLCFWTVYIYIYIHAIEMKLIFQLVQLSHMSGLAGSSCGCWVRCADVIRRLGMSRQPLRCKTVHGHILTGLIDLGHSCLSGFFGTLMPRIGEPLD